MTASLSTDVATSFEPLVCWLEIDQLPGHWLEHFPTPQEIFDTALVLQSYRDLPTDDRMIQRRDCEYALFQSVEYRTVSGGFDSIDEFLTKAQTILQRRKSRSGRSLELQLRKIFDDRWRPIIGEAERIPTKHLFTLQEGVSERQFAQMLDANVRLVVPRSLHNRYPQSVRGELMTLQDFVSEIRAAA